MNTKDIILSYLSAELAKQLSAVAAARFERFSEIRIRADKPLLIYERGKEYALTAAGALTENTALPGVIPQAGALPGIGSVGIISPGAASAHITSSGGVTRATDPPALFTPSPRHIAETLERISRYSLYAFEEELRMGYITLPGGHRVGVTGQAAAERREIRAFRHISGLNIRVAHQIKGCANAVLPLLLTGGKRPLCHTLVISPPGFGKTTLLRDIIRQVSDGVPGRCSGMNVGVVDERSELAGCYQGVAQNDIGLRTDVLDACPKAAGMVLLLRAMSPDVIAVDELGGEADARAAEEVLNAGVKLLCTAHARDLEELKRKPATAALMAQATFERFVVLSAPGVVGGVFDGGGKPLDYPNSVYESREVSEVSGRDGKPPDYPSSAHESRWLSEVSRDRRRVCFLN